MERGRSHYRGDRRALPDNSSGFTRGRPSNRSRRGFRGRIAPSGSGPLASGPNLEPLGDPSMRGRSLLQMRRLPSKMATQPAGQRLPPRRVDNARMEASQPLQPLKTIIPSFGITPTRRNHDEEDVGVRSVPRMMVSSANPTPRHSQRSSAIARTSARKEGHYLHNGEFRKLKTVARLSDDTDVNTDEPSIPRMTQVAAKKSMMARKSSAQTQHREKHQSTANVAESVDLTPDDNRHDGANDTSHLLAALNGLHIDERRIQAHTKLPFLQRNIRAVFLYRCKMHHLPLEVSPPANPIQVTCRYLHEESESDASDSDSSASSSVLPYEAKVTSMTSWQCPLCNMHGVLPNQKVLDFHLEQFHNEVDVNWMEPKTPKDFWRLYLTMPTPVRKEPDEQDDLDIDDDPEPEPEPEPNIRQVIVISDDSDTDSDAVVEVGPPQRPVITEDRMEVSHQRVETIAPPVLEIRHKLRPPSPPLLPDTRQKTVETTRRSYRGSLPERYPSPPPPTNPHGPAAQHPYLYAVEKEGETLYSCRTNGPKVYDLLNSLSLEPFGVMSWLIVDREEELFELESMTDPDKSMLALWNRWIMLNRKSFIFDGYLKGVKVFIDEYWRMIHLAAGWGALRAFLLMLMTNRYLTIREVSQALKHYEEKTGMSQWYQDGPEVDE